ncbi:MAG: CRISPR-associated endoribonuclease Cas2 [Methanomicrobiales archaeon 53_19]|nr:MAG: CRISPR-associated endoribonuclease Cas2 [Methanomicrobiales archaeon 53_19]
MSGLNVYIVSYDISDQKRLYAVHKTMKGYGDPLHYSVFRCHLSPKGKVELVVALTNIIKHDDDRVMIIHLGPLEGEADKRIEFLGIRPEVNNQSTIII